MEIKIGNSPESWGVMQAEDPNQISWDVYLDELQKAGYGWSELGPYGYMTTDVEEIQSHIDSINLKIIGGFIFDNLHISKEHDLINKNLSEILECETNLKVSSDAQDIFSISDVFWVSFGIN